MNELKEIEGVVIRSFAYGEHDKILHIFTPDEGMVHLIAKGALRQKKKGSLSVEPFTLGTFFYKHKPHHKLYQCFEVVPTNLHQFLRRHIDKLNCACQMALAVVQTQMSNQAAPQLFGLLCYYLKKLETSSNPASILASFRLKLLRHDGVLSLPAHCCVCETTLLKFWFYGELTYCKAHAPQPSEYFSEEEAQQLTILALTKEFSDIETAYLPPELVEKINLFFKPHTNRHENSHTTYSF